MKILLVFLTLSLFVSQSRGALIESTAAASYQAIENEPTDTGLSLRIRVRHFGPGNGNRGIFYGGNLPGISPILGTFYFGYGWSTQGSWSWDAGAGVFAGAVWGQGLMVSAGVTKDIGSGWSLSIPLIYKIGLYPEITPYVGWKF